MKTLLITSSRSLMDLSPVDLTVEHEFETQQFPSFQEFQNPFLNDDVTPDDVIEIGHSYNLRKRISYKLNVIKMIVNQLELDLAIALPK